MRAGQIREGFSQLERCVGNAAQACRASPHSPEELHGCIEELGRESGEARRLIDGAEPAEQDSRLEHLRHCVERLEEIGGRAMEASRRMRELDGHLQAALSETQSEIAKLKQQLR